MNSEAAWILFSVLLQDSVILVLVVAFFWAGVFVARRFGYRAGYRLGALGLDPVILAVVGTYFWAGLFVARQFGYRGHGLGALGLARPKPGYFAAVSLGISVGIGALIFSFLMLPLSTYLVEWFGYSSERSVQEPLMQDLGDWIGENPGVAIPATVFVVVLFAPAVEEVVFRGAIFGGSRKLVALLFARLRRSGKGKAGETAAFVLAALASSAGFALLHLEPALLPTLLVLAVALCALYRWTGSLLASYLAHATFNSFATLLIVLSGLGVLPPQ